MSRSSSKFRPTTSRSDPHPGLPHLSLRPGPGVKLHRVARLQPEGRQLADGRVARANVVIDLVDAKYIAQSCSWYAGAHYVGCDARFFVWADGKRRGRP